MPERRIPPGWHSCALLALAAPEVPRHLYGQSSLSAISALLRSHGEFRVWRDVRKHRCAATSSFSPTERGGSDSDLSHPGEAAHRHGQRQPPNHRNTQTPLFALHPIPNLQSPCFFISDTFSDQELYRREAAARKAGRVLPRALYQALLRFTAASLHSSSARYGSALI
jgi:hypothetical protein